MKSILLTVLVACIATFTFAQDLNTAQINRCSSYEVFQRMLQSDPSFAKNQQSIEQFTQKFLSRGGTSSMRTTIGTPVYTIPVIVHVVYHTTAQNISDAQIQSQIDVLNKDYQKLNTDVGGVPSVWTGLVADCQIQFCLATVDPSGNPTTGIRRVSTTKTSFSDNDAVKYTSKGGDDAWPAADYLNLWVCKLGGGLLGYAQFPGGKAATDGVVITYTGFGTVGSAKSPYNLGRSATHEIGHWLNLRHIWGDDGSKCTGSDLVDDTPNQGGQHFGCPKFPFVSCTNGPNGDMFMNYMDYTDDRCMFMFTNGQKSRMYATLVTGGSRHSVTISGKCASQVAAVSNNAVIPNIISVVPNPVNNGSAAVSFKLDKAAQVQFIVSNVYGNTVSVISAGNQSTGEHQIRPSEFARFENGVYVIKLLANGQQLGTTRFVVNK
ncbi:MAG: zinc metalloprotease [Parafilimonas sp.]|nr:zinc metalloprotease [Parafilimonas sp.]